MRRLLVALLLVAATLAGTPAVVGTAATPAGRAGIDYVALGDSYSSGVGTRIYDPGSGSCLRSPDAYPVLWKREHAPRTFVSVACAGATTTDVLADQVSALTVGTRLVTITVGGNDAGFGETVVTCTIATREDCLSKVDDEEAFMRNSLPALLDRTYSAIRRRAPGARVVVLGYPRLFELGFCLAMSEPRRAKLNEGADVLAGVLADRAAAHAFTFADVRSRFAGHAVCTRTGAAWINGPTVPPTESYHPTVTGQASGYLPALDAVTDGRAAGPGQDGRA